MKRLRQTCDGTIGRTEIPKDAAGSTSRCTSSRSILNGDQTLIREMPLNERGDLVEAWPGGFFEEDLREIF